MEKQRDIAIFGGTFDPPTIAHEQIIRLCLERSDIDEVWVMPSGWRTDKPGMQPDDTRLGMLEAMAATSFQHEARLRITDFEMRMPTPTNTFDTVQALRRAYPKDRFWFVFGADSYQTMHTWEHGDELKRTLGMLLVPRSGAVLPPITGTIRHLPAPELVGVSSTVVREAVARRSPIEGLVSRGVARFLASHHCYEPA